ncbi:MAG: DNA-processing protein DprA, partial [Lachnospiraceae bacterium]|nr:DNA-processing protein DprA [Lachnospiraceae bacterium]
MKYAYWLSNIRGISKRKVRCLLQQGYHAIQIYEASEKELALMQFTEEEQTNIIESKKNWDVNKEWFSLMEKGIGFVSLEQEEYPKKLRMISNPPYSLYYIGKLPENNQKSVAIVGARTQSAYGSEVTEMLAKALSNHGVQVISGLAKGIDGDAHKG